MGILKQGWRNAPRYRVTFATEQGPIAVSVHTYGGPTDAVDRAIYKIDFNPLFRGTVSERDATPELEDATEDTCISCGGTGILCPVQIDGDDDFEWVVACHGCNCFSSDKEAAEGLARLVPGRVMTERTIGPKGQVGYFISPF